ncbi:MAG: NAD(+) synthase [Parcubacteria group bacterium CG2_30_36_38]|nr:MAG: NAD(+) synthase [Parcubacteria group bacterium CG2_30_36_38]
MPERDSSSKSEKDAKLVADLLGIKFKKINLTPILRTVGIYKLYPPAFLIPKKIQEMYALKKYKDLGSNNETSLLKNLKGGKGEKELKKGIAYYRIKHRLRMVMWYYYGELNNYLVVGNCNKTEKLTGFFVKHGDSAADVEPISSLFKTQVRELSSFLGVPREIIKKAPSPDLIPGITDENAIQMKLEKLDQILYGLENKIKEEEIKKETGATEKEIQYVKELMRWSLPMRELPFAPCLGDLL